MSDIDSAVAKISEVLADGMAKLGSGKPWHAHKPDGQAFDRIEIVTVPRYKESGLSGDEWRISAAIIFYRKGQEVHRVTTRNVQSACHHLAWHHDAAVSDGKGYFAGERDVCDQEGCAELATVWYRLKNQFCREGHGTEPHRETYRQFCERHSTRGDCGLEDADRNYEKIARPG